MPGELRQRALEILESLPAGDRLCHGDFHPANVLRDDRQCTVIDWSTAARGDPAADVARTCLLLKESALPDDMSQTTRALLRLSRGIVASRYLRSYDPASSMQARIARWTPVLAAARLAENIDGERSTMLTLAGRHP